MFGYEMGVSTGCSVDQVRAFVSTILGVPTRDDGSVVSGALRGTVSEVDHPVGKEVYADLLGVPATASVYLGVDNKVDDTDYLRADRAMLITAAQLAVQTDSEACLTLQLDRVLMRRTSGVLYLYDWYTQWLDTAVQRGLPSAYTMTADSGRL